MPDAPVPPWMWGMVGVPTGKPKRSDECQDECWYEGEGFQNCQGVGVGGVCILLQGKKKD